MFLRLNKFRSLRQRFTGGVVSKKDLEETLAAFNPSDFGRLQVHLIGWVIDCGKEYCFRWRGDWPQELFYAEPVYDGTGGALMERLCGPGEIHDASDPNLVDLSLAIDTVLTITTNLMKMEILDYSNLTFGHAYEILFRDA